MLGQPIILTYTTAAKTTLKIEDLFYDIFWCLLVKNDIVGAWLKVNCCCPWYNTLTIVSKKKLICITISQPFSIHDLK
jgi:hypothetical protein